MLHMLHVRLLPTILASLGTGVLLVLHAPTAAAVSVGVEAPTFTPPPGSFTDSALVTLASATPGATIRYTLGGMTPSCTTGALYRAPVAISATKTLKAVACLPRTPASAVSSGTYTITVGTPTFGTTPPGTYVGYVRVELRVPTPGATIKYTHGGTAPTCTTGTTYTIPILLVSSTTLKAIGCKPGALPSAVAGGDFTVDPLEIPTMSPGGVFRDSTIVTLSSAQKGVEIRYTIADATRTRIVPTRSSQLYTGPFTLTRNSYVLASVFNGPARPSGANVQQYDVRSQPAVFTGDLPGTHAGIAMVGLATSTPNASIRYKTSGIFILSCATGTLYREPFPVTRSMTITAVTCAPGMSSDATARGDYEIDPLAAPRITPNGGLIGGSTIVVLSTKQTGVQLRYTLDGSEPTAASPLYTDPITLTTATTVKAKSFKPGAEPSTTTTAVFTAAP